MKLFVIASVFLLSALNVQAGQMGFDAIGDISTSTFQCLKNAGYSYFIGRVYHSYGAVDTQGIQNIKNAKSAGWSDVGGYLFPCLASNCGSGASQVQAVHDALQQQGAQINTLWLDIETYHWPSSQTSNQAFIQDMVNKAK
uniref:Lysozyme n=1 Tax=Plectus sambesii TaxID=2011161 RepID=A0A914V1M3_9BILA